MRFASCKKYPLFSRKGTLLPPPSTFLSLFLGYSLEILYVHCGMRREETSAFCNWQFVSASCIMFKQRKRKQILKCLGCCPSESDTTSLVLFPVPDNISSPTHRSIKPTPLLTFQLKAFLALTTQTRTVGRRDSNPLPHDYALMRTSKPTTTALRSSPDEGENLAVAEFCGRMVRSKKLIINFFPRPGRPFNLRSLID